MLSHTNVLEYILHISDLDGSLACVGLNLSGVWMTEKVKTSNSNQFENVGKMSEHQSKTGESVRNLAGVS